MKASVSVGSGAPAPAESAFSVSATRRASSPEALADRKKVCTPSSFARRRRVGIEFRCRETKRSGCAWFAKVTRSARASSASCSRVRSTSTPACSSAALSRRATSSDTVFSSCPSGLMAPSWAPPWPGSSTTRVRGAGGAAARSAAQKNARAEDIRPGMLAGTAVPAYFSSTVFPSGPLFSCFTTLPEASFSIVSLESSMVSLAVPRARAARRNPAFAPHIKSRGGRTAPASDFDRLSDLLGGRSLRLVSLGGVLLRLRLLLRLGGRAATTRSLLARVHAGGTRFLRLGRALLGRALALGGLLRVVSPRRGDESQRQGRGQSDDEPLHALPPWFISDPNWTSLAGRQG